MHSKFTVSLTAVIVKSIVWGTRHACRTDWARIVQVLSERSMSYDGTAI